MPIDLQLEEQLLLTEFRRLDPDGKKELLDYAAFLLKKSNADATGESSKQQNQCRLKDQPQERPETVKEPIFTE